MTSHHQHIGTCSWRYDSLQGIIYPESKPFNYLQEYSRHYKTVEVDQWFWSLFTGDKVVLPTLCYMYGTRCVSVALSTYSTF
jgi:hypothetical protein